MSAEEFWALMARFEIYNWTQLIWVTIGLGGQFLFFMRFFIQWIASERKKESVVPLAFWYFSIGGGAVLLAYACYKHDLVFILGQGGGLLIYVRNLMLIYRHRARLQAMANPPAPPEVKG
jgi:lipid-A-disaccharide synthase-like uncharacterized protein